MGFFGKMIGATVKTVLTPVAVVKDVIDVAQGEIPENTCDLVESVVEDISDGVEDLFDGEL